MIKFNKKEKEYLISLLKNNNDKTSNVLTKRIERSMKPIKIRSAKNKGMAWQKECAEMISRITGIEYNQSDDQCLIHSRECGLSGADVVLRGKARGLFPYDIECKNSKTISLPSWVRQASSDGKVKDWVLFVKSQSLCENKVAIMPLEIFEKISKS